MTLEIALAPERLDDGSPEEQATFGMFTMRAGPSQSICLTEGRDFYIKGFRDGPMVAGYPVAEWLAWNFWRLSYEPQSRSAGWAMAHKMVNVGDGYCWPSIKIFSDGKRTTLISNPSSETDAKPFRYVGSQPIVLPTKDWKSAVDEFMRQVLGLLDVNSIRDTNLHAVWNDVLEERLDPHLAQCRQLEAMLGREPGEIEDGTVERLIADAKMLGDRAITEVAANVAVANSLNPAPITADEFIQLGKDHGVDANARDVVSLSPEAKLHIGRFEQTAPWRLGVFAAQALREQEKNREAKVEDNYLAAMAGIAETALQQEQGAPTNLSFALANKKTGDCVVLRQRWHMGKRFDLARIIGDHVMFGVENLHPATRSRTYRQKAQRAFAAELLSPFDVVDGMMADNYEDEEARQDVADHFGVSERTIETMLKNHGRLERDFDEDQDSLFAAA